MSNTITLRYANNFTFAKVPFYDPDSEIRPEIGIVGIPFDAGSSYRTGQRFGPSAIRTNSCILREYNPAIQTYPFHKGICDFGDINCTPFDIASAIDQIEVELDSVLMKVDKYILLGGDHTISYPSLKAMHKKHGPVSIIHFDSHLDTFDCHFGFPLTHGTPFKRAVDDGFLGDNKFHIGVRGSTYSAEDLVNDRNLGFTVYSCDMVDDIGISDLMKRIKDQIGDSKVYISIDIDVIDPAFAPGTGTPEVGGFLSREFLRMIRCMKGMNIIGADIVEVSPSYDNQAQTTALLAGSICFELLSIL
jgi:agmatinase